MPASSRPLRGSRMAKSTGSPANARAVTSNPCPGSPSSTNRPFFVPTISSVTRSAPRDSGQHVDRVPGGDRRVQAGLLAVDIDVDVAADLPALVENPAGQGRVLAFERGQQLSDGRAVELQARLAAGPCSQRAAKTEVTCHDAY